MITEKIQSLLEETAALTAATAKEVEDLRIHYLGRKGVMNDLMAEFRELPQETKREVGQKLNQLKQSIQAQLDNLRKNLPAEDGKKDALDLTRTPYPTPLGSRHPLTLVRNEIIEIFSRLGFVLADGPEIEDDWHVFSSMNFPADHPARDMQDTFFIARQPDIVLRTHTSSV